MTHSLKGHHILRELSKLVPSRSYLAKQAPGTQPAGKPAQAICFCNLVVIETSSIPPRPLLQPVDSSMCLVCNWNQTKGGKPIESEIENTR